MKRLPIAAAAVLVGTVPFQKEADNPGCENRLCATEPVVAKPKDEHVPEETPNFDDPKEWVIVMSSPIFRERRTPENLERLRRKGLSWVDTF